MAYGARTEPLDQAIASIRGLDRITRTLAWLQSQGLDAVVTIRADGFIDVRDAAVVPELSTGPVAEHPEQ